MTTTRPQEIDLIHCKMSLREDGIIVCYGKDHTYSVPEIKDINNAVGTLTGNKKALLLFVASKYSEVDSDGRQYMSTSDATIYSLAEAYIIKSFAQRLILNFVIKVAGTTVPIHFFSDFEAGIQWLKTFEGKKSDNKKQKEVSEIA